MIFFAGNDGTIIDSRPTAVYQGAAGANDIYLVAPFAVNLPVTLAFILPNGEITAPEKMTATGQITNGNSSVVNSVSNATYAVWQYTLPNEITQYYGDVTVQFFVTTAQGKTTPMSAASFTVGRGVPTVLPDTPSQDIYSQILAALAQIQTDLANGYFSANSLRPYTDTYAYDANVLVWYENSDHGQILKSLVANNTNPPYDSEGNLNSQYWQISIDLEEVYLQVTNAAQSAQQAAASAARAEEIAEILNPANYVDRSSDQGIGGEKTFYNSVTVRDTNSDYETDYTALGSRIWASGNTDYTQWGRDIEFTSDDGSTTYRLSLPHKNDTLATEEGEYPDMSVGEAEKVANSLSFGSKTYNGSSPQTITATDLGLASVYKLQGSIAYADLPAPGESNYGYVWNINDDFVTDSRFIEGAGTSCPAGTNVGVIESGDNYYFDIFGGIIDLSNYVDRTSNQTINGNKEFTALRAINPENFSHLTEYTAEGAKVWNDDGVEYTEYAHGHIERYGELEGKTIVTIPAKNGTLATTDDVSAVEGEVDKSLYNLGAFDTYVDNGDGTVTVTRKTGYIKLDGSEEWAAQAISSSDGYYRMVCTSIPVVPNFGGGSSSVINCAANYPPKTSSQTSQGIEGVAISGSGQPVIYNSNYNTEASVDSFKQWLSVNPIYLQYQTSTSYTETLIANVPLNNLDQNMTQMVREEVEKGLNLVDATSIVGIELQSSTLNIGIPINLKAGTYTVIVSTDSGEQVVNSIGVYLINASGEVLQNISYQATSNKHNTFTITSEVAEQTSAIRVYYNGIGLSGQTITGFMLTEGSNYYPYQPYNGAIVHEIQVPIYFSTTNASPASTVGGDWISLGSFTVGTTTVYAWQRA